MQDVNGKEGGGGGVKGTTSRVRATDKEMQE